MSKLAEKAELVLRSVFVRDDQDKALKRLAYEEGVSKSQIMRSALDGLLDECRGANNAEQRAAILRRSN